MIPTFGGRGDLLPDMLQALADAPDQAQAEHAAARIEGEVLSSFTASAGCLPVVTWLVAALRQMTAPGRSAALDLLATIGAARTYGPAHEQVGDFDTADVRRALAAGFDHYLAVLREDANLAEMYSCIDILDVVVAEDPRLAPAAAAALREIRTGGRPPALADAIALALDEFA